MTSSATTDALLISAAPGATTLAGGRPVATPERGNPFPCPIDLEAISADLRARGLWRTTPPPGPVYRAACAWVVEGIRVRPRRARLERLWRAYRNAEHRARRAAAELPPRRRPQARARASHRRPAARTTATSSDGDGEPPPRSRRAKKGYALWAQHEGDSPEDAIWWYFDTLDEVEEWLAGHHEIDLVDLHRLEGAKLIEVRS